MMRFFKFLLEEPVLNWSERDFGSSDYFVIGERLARNFSRDGQLCGGRVVEKQRRRQEDPFTSSQRHDPDTQDRVTTQLKKVVVHSHPLDTQHFRPNLRKFLFLRSAWGNITTYQFRPVMLRSRQRLAVNLSVIC